MDVVNKINSLDAFQKAKHYLHYYITQLGIKYDVNVIDTYERKFEFNKYGELEYIGWGVPDKEFLNTAYYYSNKHLPIMTYDEFYSEKNIDVRDCGEDWKQFGFAQRYWTEYYGAYDWIVKFDNTYN